MRPDPDTCTDVDLLRAEIRRLRAIIDATPAWNGAPAERSVPTDDRPQPALSRGDSFSHAGKSVETGNVPPVWLQRPYWVDPPSGWAYGFPRLYDPATDGDMTEWMIANGYPERLARQALPCTFTAAE